MKCHGTELLEHLQLEGIKGETFKNIKYLQKLKSLRFRVKYQYITDDDLKSIGKICNNLEILKIEITTVNGFFHEEEHNLIKIFDDYFKQRSGYKSISLLEPNCISLSIPEDVTLLSK